MRAVILCTGKSVLRSVVMMCIPPPSGYEICKALCKMNKNGHIDRKISLSFKNKKVNVFVYQ